ncbi:MAG TPA: universal stress protein [Chloroflexota bacterium]
MELRSLLVPLDSSPLAEAALPYAEAIAKATNASLRLLTVAETAGEGLIGAGAGMFAYLPNAHREALSDYLADATAKVRERGFAVTMLMLEGRAAEAIALAAERLAADLIVMATHGRGGAARWLIGSVADKVMRTGTTPVLLVQPPAEGAPSEVSLSRIMVPLDGSPLAEGALPLAAQLALATGARLILVHVEPFGPALATGFELVPDFSIAEIGVCAPALAYLQDIAHTLAAGQQVQTVALRGPVADALEDFGRDSHADLVVMATHGRGGLRRLVVGSTADRLVRSGLPVLLVRPGVVGDAQTASEADVPAAIEALSK